MHVIPVIDLMGRAVVRAHGGRRDAYRPIETPLAASSAPLDVVAGLTALYPFTVIYAADLDAILGRGDHGEALDALRAAFPEVEFWVDAGVADARGASAWLKRHERATLVLGSETLREAGALAALKGETRLVLSLDFDGARFLGPPAILETPELWPPRVIAMTLQSVGGDGGPDIARLGALRQVYGGALYAAGGVRGPDDLAALARAGIEGALVASALHDGRLRGADIAAATGHEKGGRSPLLMHNQTDDA